MNLLVKGAKTKTSKQKRIKPELRNIKYYWHFEGFARSRTLPLLHYNIDRKALSAAMDTVLFPGDNWLYIFFFSFGQSLPPSRGGNRIVPRGPAHAAAAASGAGRVGGGPPPPVLANDGGARRRPTKKKRKKKEKEEKVRGETEREGVELMRKRDENERGE